MSRYGQNGKEMTVEIRVAEAVRKACEKAALGAYEDARMDGLCHDGAWEVAVGAIRSLSVERVVQEVLQKEGRGG